MSGEDVADGKTVSVCLHVRAHIHRMVATAVAVVLVAAAVVLRGLM